MSPVSRLRELAGLFAKLGLIAFGGPAAHIAMLEDEVVARRNWMTRQHFLDLVGATNLIPGPNSTEMMMHIGYERAGWKGLIVAGGSFIIPAVTLTALAAWFYVAYGSLPTVAPFLVGIKPAVLIIILGALWRLGKNAIKGWRLAVIAFLVAAGVLAGQSEIVCLLAGGVAGMLWLRSHGDTSDTAERWVTMLFLRPGTSQVLAATVAVTATVSLWKLGWFFLKVGFVLYGSGYVLIAFLEGGLVQELGWITQAQLLDAVAIGQFTPGPVLSTATFIGFLIEGIPGAVVATLGIFLPAFLLVGMLNPLIPALRSSVWVSTFLDAVNASAVALMAAVSIEIGLQVLIDPVSIAVALIAAVAVFRYRIGSVWIVLGGGFLGFVLSLVATSL
ncbi:MAG: chromate efflux transporter [Rhodothermales bacterium]